MRLKKKENKSTKILNKASARAKKATQGMLSGMLDGLVNGTSKGTTAELAEKMQEASGLHSMFDFSDPNKTLERLKKNGVDPSSKHVQQSKLLAGFALMIPTKPTAKQKTLPKLLETVETDVMPSMNKTLDAVTFGWMVGTLAVHGTGNKLKGTIVALKKRAKELSQLDHTAVAALTESDLINIRTDLSQRVASYQMDVLSAYSSYSNVVSKIQIVADNAYKKGLAEAKNSRKNKQNKLLIANFKKVHAQRQLCPAETRPNFTYLHVACSLTLLDCVVSLLKHGAPVVHARENAHGCTPLNVAVNANAHPDQLQIIRLLLNAGADVNSQGWTKRHSNGRVSVGRTSLCTAVTMGHLNIVHFLLKDKVGADIRLRNGDGATPLILAVEWVQVFRLSMHFSKQVRVSMLCSSALRGLPR